MKRIALWATVASLAVGTACSDQETPTATQRTPLIPPTPPANQQVLSAAWTMDVNRTTGDVRITAPSTESFDQLDAQVLADYFGVEPGQPDYSIIAGDVVTINTGAGSFVSNPVGAFAPGLVRTTFDVSITNKLTGVTLASPTFPAPPTGTSGVVLFPFEIVVTETPGGATGGLGDGTEVLVELPNYGQVAPSIDWDVDPFNFFNDTGCTDSNSTSNPTTDCYRSETFGSAAGPIVEGGATSEFRQIGFDHDPTVSQFRVRMIVAADLQDATPNNPPTAEAGGPYSGGIGVATTLSGSGTDTDPGSSLTFAWDLDNDGAFETSGQSPSYTCVAAGSNTVVLQVTDNRGATATDDATVNCSDTAPIAEANGPYTGQVGSPIALSSAGSTDDGGIVSFEWDLDNDGTFETTGASPEYTCAAAGTNTVVLQVTDNATPGQTDTDNATINCIAAPDGVVNARWVDGSGAPITTAAVGSTVVLQIDVDAAAGEEMGVVQATLSFAAALLSATSAVDLACAAGSSCPSATPVPAGNEDQLNGLTSNLAVAGEVRMLQLNTQITPSLGDIHGIASITFSVAAAGTASPTLAIEASGDVSGNPNTLLVNAIPSLTITP